MTDNLETKYPLLLIHGVGVRDMKFPNYWGRIPKSLENGGAQIYYGGQDAWGTAESNAQMIAGRLDKILLESGAEKVNIIAHSKGGMDARYLISSLDYADKIASLTTISTPHHGSQTMNSLMRIPALMLKFAGFFVNLWSRIFGDKHPNFYLVCKSFTTSSAAMFNEQNPDSPKVFYQSYAGAMKRSRSDMLMWLPHAVVKNESEESDGLVSVESAKWGEFKGVILGQGGRGVSHIDEIDVRRRNFKRKPKETDAGHYNDIRNLYKEIVQNLKERGF